MTTQYIDYGTYGDGYISVDTYLPEGFRYTVSRKKHQTLRGCLDWENDINVNLYEDDVVIRIRKGKELVGQIAIQTGVFHPEADGSRTLYEAWIYCFAINPAYRNLGLGSKLLKRAELYIKYHVYADCIKLHAQKEFEDRLIPFYIDHGYDFIDLDTSCRNEPVFYKNIKRV